MKFGLNWLSNLPEYIRKTRLLCLGAFKCIIKGFSRLVFCYLSENFTPFSKAKILQREPFLTMFYLIPAILHYSPITFMLTINLNKYRQCPVPLGIALKLGPDVLHKVIQRMTPLISTQPSRVNYKQSNIQCLTLRHKNRRFMIAVRPCY